MYKCLQMVKQYNTACNWAVFQSLTIRSILTMDTQKTITIQALEAILDSTPTRSDKHQEQYVNKEAILAKAKEVAKGNK